MICLKTWTGVMRIAGVLLATVVAGCNREPSLSSGHETSVSVNKASNIEMIPREFDLGTTPLGSQKEFIANLANHGNGEFELEKVESSCGCMDVRVDKFKCGPGERIRISGLIRTRDKPGLFRHTVKLLERGEAGREFLLQIIGDAQSELEISPDTVVLKPSVMFNRSSKGVVRIQNRSSMLIRVQRPERLPDEMQSSIEKKILQPGEESEVFLLASPAHVRDQDFIISLPTTHPTESTLHFTVRIRPEQSIRVSPQVVRLGVVTKKQLLKKGSFVLRLGGTLLNSLNVRKVLVPRFIQLTKTVAEGDGQNLCLSFVDAFSGFDINGEIIVELEWKQPKKGGEKSLRLNVPVSGILQDG